jgi:hypothetical protein
MTWDGSVGVRIGFWDRVRFDLDTFVGLIVVVVRFSCIVWCFHLDRSRCWGKGEDRRVETDMMMEDGG